MHSLQRNSSEIPLPSPGCSTQKTTLPTGTAAQYAEQSLRNGRTSVRPSVSLPHHWKAAAACGGFAAESRAGSRYRSTAAGAQQQRRRSTALSSKCGQCRVDSGGTRLNTDLYFTKKLSYRRRAMSVKILSTAEDCTKKLSVCLCNVRQPHAAAAGLLLWARRPGDINRLLHGRKDLNETGSSYISLHSCLFRSNLFNQSLRENKVKQLQTFPSQSCAFVRLLLTIHYHAL